ncbi:MAG: hypothetical protein I3273_05265 [Candidatus Moeniiplasma glomeromycotorum]|nr:hypothetical protein [Candidatus Moeniiplasma glomeromycotorum]MCE8168188.1 hypothetical protein [Candidatus Moeniiplasma glomeromycotorum]MCE8169500.1 hypothetical protein [Candidatus Moeniiplasma glomeromycotorum]
MRGHNVNIYFSEETYNRIKPLIKQRKVSQFVNKLVEKELEKERKKEKEQLRERLVVAYKRMRKNKNLQKELVTLEKATMKDISRKLTRNE